MNNTPFQVYNASAGSGKTFTLVSKYLEACFASGTPYAYKNILAITFTNKAAAEMKHRVLKSLKALASDHPSGTEKAVLDGLVQKLGISPEAIQQKAQELLENILHDYSNFSIATIDKFTHRIVRSFAMDLRLPLNFEVVMDQDKLIAEVVDTLISKAGNDANLTRLLIGFMDEKSSDDGSWDPRRPLENMAKRLFEEGSTQELKKLQDIHIDAWLDLSKKLKKQIKEEETIIQDPAKKALALIASRGIDKSDFYYSGAGSYSFFEYVVDGNYSKLPSRVKTCIEKNVWHKKGGNEESIKEIASQLTDFAQEIFITLEGRLEHLITLQLFDKSLFGVAMLNEMSKILQQQKEQGQYLHISDFNRIISESIQGQPAPFLYERLGEKYQHYFIDEFQDTSIQQWKNLEPLISNALAYEHGTCMLVGDGKQSIYRFRGGDVEQFLSLADTDKLDPEWIFSTDRKEVISLENNWRSRQNIVDFNNAFFRYTSATFQDESYQHLYEASMQVAQGKEGGLVQVEFIGGEDYKEDVIARTIEVVQQSLDLGYRQKDIVVLTRGKADGQLIGEALVEKGWAVSSPDSLKLLVSNDVRFLVSCLNVLADPKQARHREHVLEYLTQHHIIEELSLEVEKEWKFASLSSFQMLLKDLDIHWDVSASLGLPVYECLETIIRAFKLEQSSNPYIELFLDLVWDYSRHNPAAIDAFIEYWHDFKDKFAVALPDNADAINVMTIHKSKGLEFPVVIFPYADFKVDMSKDGAWVENDLEGYEDVPSMYYSMNKAAAEAGGKLQQVYETKLEQTDLDVKNLMYVALTRAVDALFIFAKLEKNMEGTQAVNKLLFGHIGKEEETIGTFPHKSSEEKAEQATNYGALSTSDWRPRLRMALQADRLWLQDQQGAAAQFGTLVHQLLSELISFEDLEPLLNTYLDDGYISMKEQEDLSQLLAPIIQHPELSAFFQKGLKLWSEESILRPDGSVLRPDRVVQHEDGTVSVLDFKTGVAKEAHEMQLQQYRSLLEQMGYTVKQALLVYTQPLTIEAV